MSTKSLPHDFGPESIILTRLLKELEGIDRLAVGPGIPSLLLPHLNGRIRVVELGLSPVAATVDLAIVQALEVTPRGDLAAETELALERVQSPRWIAAMSHLHEDGESRIVRHARFPVNRHGVIDRIITELGVIDVSEVGFELCEVAPGIATDLVKACTRASLHVRDDIRIMRL